MNICLSESIVRDAQAVNIFFPELLGYNIAPRDRTLLANVKTLTDWLRSIKVTKLAQIKAGKIGTDLFSILLSEGDDIYGPLNEDA